MIEPLLHAIHENGLRANSMDKIARGCWECFHIYWAHHPNEQVKIYCSASKDENGDPLRIGNAFIVPEGCQMKIPMDGT